MRFLSPQPPAYRWSAPRAFMLIELVCVAAILLILFVVYFNPSGARYQSRKQVACRQNLQFLYLALQMYANDHTGRFPQTRMAETAEPVLSLLVPQYTTRTELFICPGSRHRKLKPAQPFADARISYAYLMGLTNDNNPGQWLLSDRQVNTLPKQTGERLFATNSIGPGSNHRQFGGNVLFTDGHTAFSPPRAAWPILHPPGTTALNPKK